MPRNLRFLVFVPTKVDQSIAILKRLLARQLTLRLLVDSSRSGSLSVVGRPDSPMLSSIEELCESGQKEIQDANQPKLNGE